MATVQYQDKKTGIIFSSVDVDSSPKVAIGGKLYRSGWSNTAITGISNTDIALPANTDAIFIDWNGATLGSTVINTTADLLDYIQTKSDLTIGNTSYTAAAGDHTHELTLQKNAYAISSIDLLDNTVYTLTAGGKSLAFKTPSVGTTYKAGTNITINSNTISHATPSGASLGKKGNISTTNTALLATITTDAQGHVTGYEEISPAELWRLLQQYADALYQPKPVEVLGISLNKSDMTVPVATTAMIVATISPSNATNQNITWTSSNDAIATVTSHTTSGSPANVSFKTTGTVTITATADGNTSKTATCKVTCESPQPTTTYYYSAGTTEVTILNYTTANDAKSVTNVSDIPDSLDISSISRQEAYFVLPNGLTPIVKTSANLPVTILTVATVNSHTIYKTDGRIGSGSTCTISK